MAAPIIELKNVSKRYGGVQVLRSVSFHVHAGEIYGMVGPNGSGKSALTKLIVGLHVPSRGTIRISGSDVQTAADKAKAMIGFVPDELFADDTLTGREYLEFVGELYGMVRAKRDAEIGRLLAECGLTSVAESRLGRIPAGARQMLSFVAAFLHSPAALIIDEPMQHLDPESAALASHMIREFARNGGAVLLATNALGLVDDTCHRVGVLQGGTIAIEGRVSQVKSSVGVERGPFSRAYFRIVRGI